MKKKWLLIIIGILVVVIILAIWLMRRPGKPQISMGPSAQAILQEAKDFEAKGKTLEARNAYQKLISEQAESQELSAWQKKVDDLNIKLLFSPVVTPKSILYEIKSGDTLTKIAKDHNTTVELLKKSNNLKDDMIIPGRKIKVWTAPFTLFVDKSQNILMLKSDEEVIKTYIVSTGINNSTPTGTFKISEKLINPTWFKAGAVVLAGSPENILGTRWMGFDLAPGYGIHGTTDPQSLGKQVTQGCVRMANSDVEELYIIVPKGTEISIVD